MMKSGEILAEGFMGMRFRNVTKINKKLEEKDTEFFMSVLDFFDDALDGMKSNKDFTISPIKNALHNWGLCLELIPNVYGFETVIEVQNTIDEFRELIMITLDLGEIHSELFSDMRKFFIALQEKSINDFPQHRCYI